MDNKTLEQTFYSISIPLIKELFFHLLTFLDMKSMFFKVDEICGHQPLGSLKISYKHNNEMKDTYLVLKICYKNHDLTKEFDKLQPYLSEEQWQKILQSVSMLIYIVRMLYKNLFPQLSLEDSEKYSELQIDPTNTTLFLEDIDERIGVFIDDCIDV